MCASVSRKTLYQEEKEDSDTNTEPKDTNRLTLSRGTRPSVYLSGLQLHHRMLVLTKTIKPRIESTRFVFNTDNLFCLSFVLFLFYLLHTTDG